MRKRIPCERGSYYSAFIEGALLAWVSDSFDF